MSLWMHVADGGMFGVVTRPDGSGEVGVASPEVTV
jgi:hypothetical protein